ncbi:hypothetical protein R1flu_017946 [Riccia fluitans]|uniref:Uncharacterized protein n=1 Tax=Riccia fluitans TaxID=41844 RepID=A0ABD1ZEN7_9MARC
MGQEQCDAFAKSLQRLGETIGTIGSGNEAAAAIVTEVERIIRGFKIVGKAYVDMLVLRLQEVKVLQKEKHILQRRLEQLGVSSEVSAVLVEGGERSVEASGDLEAETRRRRELESDKLELELAKLRQAYTSQTLELRACRNQVLRLEVRLKNAESMVAMKEKERLELELRLANVEDTLVKKEEQRLDLGAKKGKEELEIKLRRADDLAVANEKRILELETRLKNADDLAAVNKNESLELQTRLKKAENLTVSKEKEKQELMKKHSDEMSSLKDDMMKVTNETRQLSKETGILQEKLRRATAKNELLLKSLKKGSGLQDDQSKQLKTLKGYLQTLAKSFSSKEGSHLHSLQTEMKIVECMGLDEETISFLKVILERSLKPSEVCVREKSSDQASLMRTIEVIDLDDDCERSNEESPAAKICDDRKKKRV